MILKLMDGKEFFLTDKQSNQVSDMLTRGAEWIKLPDGSTIKASVIASITPGVNPSVILESHKLFEDKRVATDEGIARARARLVEKMDKKN